MQPPPRKGNYAKFLKNLHSEQIAKLQLKNQHECDLLEDIRSFTIKRSAIEKSYSEALLKISSAYLNKKIPNIPDIKLDGGEEKWNMWNVWRTVLEENEKLAKARLAAVEVFQQQIADEAKVLRSHKVQASRKSVDQLAIVQKELQVCVQDVDKTKKLYFDEEHSAHDVRDKAKDLEEKLKKKKGSFFQSITSLQKNSAKFSSKRDQLEEKSTGARNDYLLCLAAANAHQNRYFVVDLQMAMSTMESGVFEKVAEYLTLMGRTELLTCSATQHSFGKIRDQAQQLTREYNLQCCYLYYPVLKQHIQYDFEPCDNDPVEHVTADHESAAATLSKEARRWATRIARENNSIRENIRKVQVYNALREAGQKVDPNDQNGPDLETKIDELRQAIRRSETAKMKAEARIECLRAGGVNVDEWMQEAETLSVQDIPRSASSLSVRTDASGVGDHPSSDSFYDSDFADGEPAAPVVERSAEAVTERQRTMSKPDSDEGHDDSAEVDAMLEQERQRIEQLTAGWDDPTQVDWGTDEPEAVPVPAQPTGPILKCTALYSYTAQNPDELSIVENEQLEVVGEGDGDGWLRARNYRGEEGYVPHNYLDVEPLSSAQSAAASAGSQAGPGQLQTQISFSSVDYTIDHEDDTAVSSEQNQSPEQISVISVPAQQTPSAMYCIALYDYEGDEEQELTFDEGQIIRITNKCAHGVDDGWWEGELEGRIGNFPSLVVEECDENGEPITSQWDETPPCSAPPVLTPPEPPSFLLNTEVIVTQPTPMVEQGQEQMPDVVKQTDKPSKKGFAMSLSKGHHDQYDTQFQGDEAQNDNGIPCVVIQDEDGEETEDATNDEDDFGLCAAQIVITAATPMIEEPEHPFPPVDEEETVNHEEDANEEEDDQEVLPDPSEAPPPVEENTLNGEDIEEKSVADDQPTDSAPFPVSSSSEGETTGPSTAENSQSHAPPATTINDDIIVGEPKQVVGGRASIPDELEPHQLARLQDLKESNA